jgi:tRNA(Ile)-lysidine synthase TilS/MesJ
VRPCLVEAQARVVEVAVDHGQRSAAGRRAAHLVERFDAGCSRPERRRPHHHGDVRAAAQQGLDGEAPDEAGAASDEDAG